MGKCLKYIATLKTKFSMCDCVFALNMYTKVLLWIECVWATKIHLLKSNPSM